MSGSTTGISTTFDLPNYHGELIGLTPADTPLLSASGGLTGGKQTESTSFEWSTYDLRAAASRARLEGASAPTAEQRVRGVVENVCQIFHETVETSYTKAATAGMYRTAGSAPFNSNSGGENAVKSEHSWQVMQSLKQIARDVNYCFWNGVKVKPTTNGTARAMGGLLSVSTSNAQTKTGSALTASASAATDTITATHDMAADDKVVFTDVGASTTIVVGRAYWVKSVTSTTSFKIAETRGGAAITVGTATVSFYAINAANIASVADVNGLLQQVFDNGGINEQATATLFVPSGQKLALSTAYANAYGKADALAGTRNVGGVNLNTIVTDFGVLNVAVERALPADAIAIVSLEQVSPVFLSIPNKGVLFEEELAKVGSSDRTQIYGEIGLEYGNEAAHGVLRGLYA
ncbi:DUF5309 family protein [Jatrophihabitans sp.]|uniref:SU10 major capsid protein n=1 Tax=Jatrophihabitans sp. TaxID=1932789 RepID=UPI0030C6787F|nr:hypothetical protein [Jatrophihabitans sp.]